MNKGTILSVDDDENLQTVIGQYLEGDGYKVVKAVNAVLPWKRRGRTSWM